MPDELESVIDLAAEIWAVSSVGPNEGIEGAINRIAAIIEADRLAVAEKVREACADALVEYCNEMNRVKKEASFLDAYRRIRAIDINQIIGGDNGAA